MNENELARKMLEYADAQERADRLRAVIEAAVMELGKTQTVGNVKATYRKGRKSYDYRAAAEGASVDGATISQFTTQPPPKVDWRKVCGYAGIEDVPFTVGEPSVSVKLV